jgi:hypothetical protein
MDLSHEDDDNQHVEAAQALDPEIAERLFEGHPVLSESARSRIQTATAAAYAKLREARRYLEQVGQAEALLASLEFSVGASDQRLKLRNEREMFLWKAWGSARKAAGELFQAYATEYWEVVDRDADQFPKVLSVISEAVRGALACPELNEQITTQISHKTLSWISRISKKETESSGQAAVPEAEPPLPAYWNNPTPLYYFETWDLTALNQRERDQIKANLLRLHAAFLEGRTGAPPHVECWRRAYDVFAEPLYATRLLDEKMLIESIPAMVLDAGACGRWKFGQISYGSPMGRCCFKFGNEYYDESFIRGYFDPYLEGRINDWRGKLMIQGQGGSETPGTDQYRKENQSRYSVTALPKGEEAVPAGWKTAQQAGADPGGTIWTHENEKRISECVTSGSEPSGTTELLSDRNSSAISAPAATVPERSLAGLSKRDAQVHDIVGSQNLRALTNTEIMKIPGMKRGLRTECQLEPGDAAKSCLDRIRRAKGYPLSRQISEKRSTRK